jgi:hypothetical protein
MSSLVSSDFSIENDISNNPMSIPNELVVPFWSDNPNVLLQGKYIAEFFPVSEMTFNQKLNAISRTVLILSIVLFFIYPSSQIVLVSLMTLGAIFMLHFYRKKENDKKLKGVEAFENPALAVIGDKVSPTDTFDSPSDTNPFSNVLLPDYDYNPQKKPAPPAFNTSVNQSILEQAKQLVVDQNPGQPDIAKKLFTDLGEQFVFEQSLQPFYSNPATTIPNDQAGFADFCYGSMVSCKEGNMFACARNLDRHTN